MNTHDPEFWQLLINIMDFIQRALLVVMLVIVSWLIFKLHQDVFGKKKNH